MVERGRPFEVERLFSSCLQQEPKDTARVSFLDGMSHMLLITDAVVFLKRRIPTSLDVSRRRYTYGGEVGSSRCIQQERTSRVMHLLLDSQYVCSSYAKLQ